MTSSVQYASVDELRAMVELPVTKYDVILGVALDAAARLIDYVCNRAEDGFVALETATAREFVGTGLSFIHVSEFVELTGVGYKTSTRDTSYTTLAVSYARGFSGSVRTPQFHSPPYRSVGLLPTAPISTFIDGRLEELPRVGAGMGLISSDINLDIGSGLQAVPTVQITARWGYSDSLPPQIKMATLGQAARWFQRGRAMWADATAQNDFAALLYKRVMDPDIELMLKTGRLIRPVL